MPVVWVRTYVVGGARLGGEFSSLVMIVLSCWAALDATEDTLGPLLSFYVSLYV